MTNERPKPYRRMIAYIATALVVAFILAGWYSYHVHPGDAQAPASASAPSN